MVHRPRGNPRPLSGAIYPFAKLRETQLLAQVRQAIAGAATLKLNAENMRDLAETEIARAWMAQWFKPTPLPQIRDAATGDPMLLVTDHYGVRDAVALAAALAAQPDVTGDARQGRHRGETRDGDGQLRSLMAINPGREADGKEVVCRTQRLADENRTWFVALAGSAVQHLTRVITDPAGSLTRAHAGNDDVEAPQSAASPAPAPPPEALARALKQFIHRHCARWWHETIPALGDLTPRQAITTPAGLERVKGLLREYEDSERRQSAPQSRPPVSYQFLRDALGISR